MGIVFYKTVNTMDSMVGYRNARYKKFGMFSAKLDDVANWIPARIGSFFILAAGVFNKGSLKQGFATMRRDRHLHASPNSAYAEAAVAGLYSCRLGGPSIYFGVDHSRPWIGKTFENPTWEVVKQVKENIWISEILFVVIIEGGMILWA
jgi:adenosylcobinamide-phosphate synthase